MGFHSKGIISPQAGSHLGFMREMQDVSGEAARAWGEVGGAGRRESLLLLLYIFHSHPGSYKISQEVRNLTATCADRWIAEVNIVINNMERELNAILELLTKFQAVSGISFKLKKEQESAVKSLLLNREVLAVLPTGYGKSLVFQCYVAAREVLENAKVSLLVICL